MTKSPKPKALALPAPIDHERITDPGPIGGERDLDRTLRPQRLEEFVGQESLREQLRIDLKRFTLIGATTRTGLLSAPLRGRFGLSARLDYYTTKELTQIIRRSAQILKVPIDAAGARELAARSRGTPRVGNRLLRRVRDYAETRAQGKITEEVARAGLKLLEVDSRGLDDMDRRML